jgi:molybdopterin-containing oxidoreductase family iron-sulfur binding subunit
MKDPTFIPLESICHAERSNLATLREKLRRKEGPAFWRSLAEAEEGEDVRAAAELEFARATDAPDEVDRRSALKMMAASLAMAGAAACTRQPKEVIVPYVRQPENVIPGLPLFYATAMPLGGYARGLLVESHLNRPTKVEGNPDHPGSLGATGIFEQASVLSLYDPDRSRTVLHLGQTSTWGDFAGVFIREAQRLAARKGEGLAVLTRATTSPTFLQQMSDLLRESPSAKWYVHEPSSNPAVASAARKIAGRNTAIVYDFGQADVIVTLESDFTNAGPGALAYSRQFAAKRKVDNGARPCRLYAMESTPSVTGSLADHRFAVKSSAIPTIAYQLAKLCGAQANVEGTPPQWLNVIAQDLLAARGHCVVVPGEYQPESVHLAAFAMNKALGNVGRTVRLIEGIEPENTNSVHQLRDDLRNGRIEMLVILGPNPVYSMPASSGFGDALRRAPLVVHLGQYYDETSRWSHWHIPEAHYLETWSDSRAYDGTATIQQPLTAPLYDGKSAHELLAFLLNNPYVSSHDIVKGYWRTRPTASPFETAWQKALHDGIVAGTAAGLIEDRNAPGLPPLHDSVLSPTEIAFRPDPTIGDGAWTNNAWLQELPKPATKLTWDNAVVLSPKKATELGATNGDVLRVDVNGRTVEGPAWILPGQDSDSVTVYFGYGREGSGRIGAGIGYNAYALLPEGSPFCVSGSIAKTGRHYRLANTQETQTMAGRAPIRAAGLEEFQQHPDFATQEEKPTPHDLTLYPDFSYDSYKWGMVIDLNVCTGCSACILACQAENNIAVVGKDQVARGRHMHWIRVDRYYSGNLDEPEMYNQPVPCMQCENAPCEVVCPVAATVHSDEGLNQMVYNRCVGTRYCSNNCPYKVRRFNFYLYSDWQTPSLYGLRNPDVTVRSRGVMEKCTYCTQRIQEAKIKADREDRLLQDGEILTACQQVCPTQAITFGDLNNPASKAAKLRALPRNYSLLDDLNTRPRTTYLSYVRNANEALRGASGNRRS